VKPPPRCAQAGELTVHLVRKIRLKNLPLNDAIKKKMKNKGCIFAFLIIEN